MNPYVTGQTIQMLREKRGLTQKQLAELLFVSDKTISKWETGKGLPARGRGWLYYCCNQHGLFRMPLPPYRNSKAR